MEFLFLPFALAVEFPWLPFAIGGVFCICRMAAEKHLGVACCCFVASLRALGVVGPDPDAAR